MRFRKIRSAIGLILTAMIMAAGMTQISADENDSGFTADTNSIKNTPPDSMNSTPPIPSFRNSDSIKSTENDSSFLGEIKKYQPIEISPSCQTLELSIKLPDGMKFNHLVPLNIEMASSRPEVVQPQKLNINTRSAKLKLPITVNPGESVMTVDLHFSYCGIKNSSLCYFKDARLFIPVTVTKNADNNFSIKYEVFE